MGPGVMTVRIAAVLSLMWAACGEGGLRSTPRPSSVITPSSEPDAAGPSAPVVVPEPSGPSVPPEPPPPPPPPPKFGDVAGVFCAGNEEPLVNGEVWIEVDGKRYEATTDADGAFLLEDVPVGAQTVVATQGLYRTEQAVNVVADQEITMPSAECVSLKKLRIAVYVGGNDDIASVLQDLGADDITRFYDFPARPLLFDATVLAGFDALFIGCGVDILLPSNAAVLKDFVAAGGTLYVSDHASPYLEQAWPNVIDFVGDDLLPEAAQQGITDEVDAIVNPPLLAALQSDTARLEFAAGWSVMLSTTADVWVEADVTYRDGNANVQGRVPLMVVFDEGKGRVAYTSFHAFGQEQGDVRAVIELLIGAL
jgi:hypothetical protein